MSEGTRTIVHPTTDLVTATTQFVETSVRRIAAGSAPIVFASYGNSEGISPTRHPHRVSTMRWILCTR